jgi:hypothetical protein
MKTREEKLLDQLFGEEKKKLTEQQTLIGKTPKQIVWA